jgi:protein-tyrosine phosphatase
VKFILDNLAIGNFEEAQAPPAEIDALLCVAQEIDLTPVDRLYCKVPIVDMQPIPAGELREAVEFIAGNISAHKILVFCNAGVGRSPSVVVAYLCCKLGYGFGQAVEHVARCKPFMSVLPNLILSIEALREQTCKKNS